MLRLVLIALGSALLPFGAAVFGDDESPAGKLPLRVLYAGNRYSDRANDFAAFLAQHFSQVTVAQLGNFKAADADEHDVVIFDWTSNWPRDKTGKFDVNVRVVPAGPRPPTLPHSFSRPSVLIGHMGGLVASSLALKIHLLNGCSEGLAHGVAARHEIFQRPFPIELKFEEVDTPANYRNWPGGADLAKKLKVWKVQNKGFFEIDPGLACDGFVCDPYGFGDSPDCEAISSGGINNGSPEALALGRQGNFFFWGFGSPPSDMTQSGRNCFLNAICYIKKFGGQAPLVRTRAWMQGRRWTLRYSRDIKDYGDMFPKKLRAEFGMDADKYLAYCEANLEYLHPVENRFEADEDVKSLGLSNREIGLLDRCIKMLEDKDQAALARRILKRYTTENFSQPDEWRAWLERNRDRLFFTDMGGYKFLIN